MKKARAKRPPADSGSAPATPPRSLGASALKWAGGITAFLSALFALPRLTQLISDTRERQRTIAEFHRMGTLQQSASDYAAAWPSVETVHSLTDTLLRALPERYFLSP